jgi:hypothetical protein
VGELARRYGTRVVRWWTVKLITLTMCCLKNGDVPRSPLPEKRQPNAVGFAPNCAVILFRQPRCLFSQTEERPMNINWDVVKPSLWTGAGGVIVGMWLLSYGFGFMSHNSAEKLVSASSEKAVIAVLAPVCADKFSALQDVAERTVTLVANKDSSYKMREAFPEAMITLPGKSYPDSDLTAACAALILAPPKSADLKQ